MDEDRRRTKTVAIITNATRSVPRELEEERAHAVVQCAVHPQRPPLPILLIEDSDEDHAALVRALDGMPALAVLHRCTRGDEALDYLHGRGRFGYHVKAIDYPRFRDEMRLIVAYWLSVCVLPANAEERRG